MSRLKASYKRLTCLSLLALSSIGNATASCSVSVGDTIKSETAVSLMANLKAFNATLTKDEYETTEEFKARIAMADQAMQPRSTHFIQAPLYRKYIEYNADASQFWLAAFAFDNMGVDWRSSIPARYDYKARTQIDGRINPSRVVGVGLQYRTFPDVTGKARQTIGVMSKYDGVAEVFPLKEWVFDGRAIFETYEPSEKSKIFGSDGKFPFNYITVNIPRSEARGMKEKFRLAYEIRPREPYLHSGTTTDYANGEKITDYTEVIVGWINCGIITDDRGTVLRTFFLAR